MRITKKELAFQGNYLRVVMKHFETDLGQEGIWETVERTNIHDRGAVVIVPLTKSGEVILERNWRAPSESFVIQFPAGLTDVDGETEEETTRRELLEKTGYLAKKLIPIILTPLSPDLTPTEAIHFFAPDVEFVGDVKRDVSEIIQVLKVPVRKVDEFLLNLPEDTKLDLRVPGILWVLEKRKLI